MRIWQEIKNIYHLFVAVLANIVYSFPGRKVKVIGVTGTDGKTTTVSLIYHILKESGLKVSMVSSIGATINDREYETGFHVTTPSSFSLQRFIKKAINEGSTHFVLEVTSHALDQNRVWGTPFDIGALTNVTSEHLDYHRTYEEYLETKKKLLKMARVAIVNKDDQSYSFLRDLKNEKSSRMITYGSKDSDVTPSKYSSTLDKLGGEFNKYNALCAISVCKILKIKDNDIKKALETFSLPIGRLDFVYSKDFKVMIDFAHTPNAFFQLLSFLRPLTTGRIIHVFGSAGERDKGKRPVLGKISSDFANVIILTSEDPRKEKVGKISEEIVSGIKSPVVKILKIENRQKAINKAVAEALENDLVLITGKAHERSMNYGLGEEPWDEYEAVRSALRKRGIEI